MGIVVSVVVVVLIESINLLHVSYTTTPNCAQCDNEKRLVEHPSLWYNLSLERSAMSLDDKLKNYAKYQLDYERAASNRKVFLRLSIVVSAAVALVIIYLLGI